MVENQKVGRFEALVDCRLHWGQGIGKFWKAGFGCCCSVVVLEGWLIVGRLALAVVVRFLLVVIWKAGFVILEGWLIVVFAVGIGRLALAVVVWYLLVVLVLEGWLWLLLFGFCWLSFGRLVVVLEGWLTVVFAVGIGRLALAVVWYFGCCCLVFVGCRCCSRTRDRRGSADTANGRRKSTRKESMISKSGSRNRSGNGIDIQSGRHRLSFTTVRNR